MVSFSRALAVWQMGAGQAQLIAFLAAWSAFAVYRIISYELPLISPGFCSSSHPIGSCCRLSQDPLPQLFLSLSCTEASSIEFAANLSRAMSMDLLKETKVVR